MQLYIEIYINVTYENTHTRARARVAIRAPVVEWERRQLKTKRKSSVKHKSAGGIARLAGRAKETLEYCCGVCEESVTWDGVVVEVPDSDGVAHKRVVHRRRSLGCVQKLVYVVQVLRDYLSWRKKTVTHTVQRISTLLVTYAS